MIFADVFGQTQVMQLGRPEKEETGYHGYKAGRVVTTETHVTWKNKDKKILRDCPTSGDMDGKLIHLWFS